MENVSTMVPADMVALRESLGLNQTAFGDLIGRTKRAVVGYEAGAQPIPRTVALACRAVAEGWRDFAERDEFI